MLNHLTNILTVNNHTKLENSTHKEKSNRIQNIPRTDVGRQRMLMEEHIVFVKESPH